MYDSLIVFQRLSSPSGPGSSEESDSEHEDTKKLRGRKLIKTKPKANDKTKLAEERSTSSESGSLASLVERRKTLTTKMEIPDTPHVSKLVTAEKVAIERSPKSDLEIMEDRQSKLRRFNLSMTPQSSPELRSKTPSKIPSSCKGSANIKSEVATVSPLAVSEISEKTSEGKKAKNCNENQTPEKRSGSLLITLPNFKITGSSGKNKSSPSNSKIEKSPLVDNRTTPLPTNRVTRSDTTVVNQNAIINEASVSNRGAKNSPKSELIKKLPKPPENKLIASCVTRSEASKNSKIHQNGIAANDLKRKRCSTDSSKDSMTEKSPLHKKDKLTRRAEQDEGSSRASRGSKSFGALKVPSAIKQLQKKNKMGTSLARLPSLKNYKIPKNNANKDVSAQIDENQLNGDFADESELDEDEKSPSPKIVTRNSSKSPDKSKSETAHTNTNGHSASLNLRSGNGGSSPKKELPDRTTIYPLRKVNNHDSTTICPVINAAGINNNNNISVELSSPERAKHKGLLDGFFACDSTVSSDGELAVQLRSNPPSSDIASFNVEESVMVFEHHTRNPEINTEFHKSDTKVSTTSNWRDVPMFNINQAEIDATAGCPQVFAEDDSAILPDSTTPDVEMIISNKTKRTESLSDEVPSPKQPKISDSPECIIDRNQTQNDCAIEIGRVSESKRETLGKDEKASTETGSSTSNDFDTKSTEYIQLHGANLNSVDGAVRLEDESKDCKNVSKSGETEKDWRTPKQEPELDSDFCNATNSQLNVKIEQDTGDCSDMQSQRSPNLESSNPISPRTECSKCSSDEDKSIEVIEIELSEPDNDEDDECQVVNVDHPDKIDGKKNNKSEYIDQDDNENSKSASQEMMGTYLDESQESNLDLGSSQISLETELSLFLLEQEHLKISERLKESSSKSGINSFNRTGTDISPKLPNEDSNSPTQRSSEIETATRNPKTEHLSINVGNSINQDSNAGNVFLDSFDVLNIHPSRTQANTSNYSPQPGRFAEDRKIAESTRFNQTLDLKENFESNRYERPVATRPSSFLVSPINVGEQNPGNSWRRNSFSNSLISPHRTLGSCNGSRSFSPSTQSRAGDGMVARQLMSDPKVGGNEESVDSWKDRSWTSKSHDQLNQG